MQYNLGQSIISWIFCFFFPGTPSLCWGVCECIRSWRRWRVETGDKWSHGFYGGNFNQSRLRAVSLFLDNPRGRTQNTEWMSREARSDCHLCSGAHCFIFYFWLYNTRHSMWIVYWGCISQIWMYFVLHHNLYLCKSQLLVLTIRTCTAPDTKNHLKTHP